MIENTAKILKAVGEPTRLKIIMLLSARELCICELVAILDMSQPSISQHVKVLKQARIVTERKERQSSYLSVNQTILNKGIIEPFKSLMLTDLMEISNMEEECVKLAALDCNEEVITCKEHGQADKSIANII